MQGLKKLSGGTRPIVWGLIIGLTGLLVLTALIVLMTALSYDGECGGLLPFMGESRECGLWEYMSVQLPFILEVVVVEYWYFLAAILLAPVIILRTYYEYLLRRTGVRKS